MRTAFVVACALAGAAQGQVFSILPERPPAAGAWAVAGPRPVRGTIVGVDAGALGALLAQAPAQRFDAPLGAYGLAIVLPSPSGALVECLAAESSVMEAPLQARFGQIRTYIVQSADGGAAGRVEVSPRGITAMLRTTWEGEEENEGVWMIDPWQSDDPLHAVAYWLRDLPGGGDWACHTTEGVHGFGTDEADDGGMQPRDIQTLRTVRLAVACTGEYGVHQSTIQGHAPNAADPLAAIVTMVSRANVVYEADLAVHMNLVGNNDLIIYFDPATDPYPDTCDGTGGADCSGVYLTPNINTLSNVIGNSNFDIGHLQTRVYGGVAYLSSVCGPNKAGGISGIPRGGDIDPFTALIAIHEMGHQFGANHTFSGTRGRCAGNVRLASAWEAGSGSSPMAYAGGCPVGDAPPSDNIVQFAEPYFHHGSVREMQTFLAAGGTTCPVQTSSGNNIPLIVSTSGDNAVPPGTPFVLTAAATDADGDLLAYSWEQFDSGVARPLSGTGSEDNGMGALFRTFPPVSSPQRTFPKMADVLAGVPTPGERLPTVTGVNRRFRVIVRDNHAGAGGVAVSSFVNLAMATGASAFGVISPAAGAVLNSGSNTVTWTVGGTSAAPILCASVTIRLSTDDGATFGQVLGSFPNTGTAMVMLPETSAPAARIRIDGDGRIFFAVSRPFVLQGECAGDHNRDGVVNSQDFFDFLGAFFQLDPGADFNQDGTVNSQDFFDFLGAFFDGCP